MALRMAWPPASNLATSLSWAEDWSMSTKTIGRVVNSDKTASTVDDLSVYNDEDDEDDVDEDAELISCWNLLNGETLGSGEPCCKEF